MFPTMSDNNRPTTPRAVAQFENDRGVALPSLYKEFLLATNGGRPRTPAFPIQGMAHNTVGTVHFFFGLDANLPVYDLAGTFDWFKDKIPSGIILIASTDAADYVCMDLRSGPERVAFWDHRYHWGTGEWRESDFYHVANSFEEFLASLRPNPY
jgi:hypothetical protein